MEGVQTARTFTRLHPTARRLIAARAFLAVAQGIGVVDLTLYLKALHWSGAAIGGVLTAAGLFGSLLILFVGVLSDRTGRKPFLLVYQGMMVLSGLAATATANPAVLGTVIVVAGFGRGQSGASGPFSPAEQAWLAAVVPRSDRGNVFSINNAVGFFGMALGALIGGTTVLWQDQLPGALAFRPLFLLMALISGICGLIILGAPAEPRHAALAPKPSERGERDDDRAITAQENQRILKLSLISVLNGLAVGLTGPMMAYWFALKFGASTSEIGATISLGFLLTGLSSLFTGWLAQRYGMVRSVVWLRIVGTALMVLVPLMPAFWLASGVYVVRSALSRGTQGARSALSASITRDQRRGLSVSINALSMRLPSAAGPTISGWMLDANALALPFYVTAALQLLYALLYGRMFREYDKPEVGEPTAAGRGGLRGGEGVGADREQLPGHDRSLPG